MRTRRRMYGAGPFILVLVFLHANTAVAELQAGPNPNPPAQEAQTPRELRAPVELPQDQWGAAQAALDQLSDQLSAFQKAYREDKDSEQTAKALEVFLESYEGICKLYKDTECEASAIAARADVHGLAGEHEQAKALLEQSIERYGGTVCGLQLRFGLGYYLLLSRQDDADGAFKVLGQIKAPPLHVPNAQNKHDPFLVSRSIFCQAQVVMAECEVRLKKPEAAAERIQATANYLHGHKSRDGMWNLKAYHTQYYRRYLKAIEDMKAGK